MNKNKRPIDKYRESGGRFTTGTGAEGALIEFVHINDDSLHHVMEKAIYEVKLADQIDPKRENPCIPHNVQQCILQIGSDSEIVGRTLLTAKNLFQSEYLHSSIDVKQCLKHTLDVLIELATMQELANDYELIENKEIELYEKRQQSGESLVLPSISDIKTRCKTFIQKADHVEQNMLKISKLFYPKASTKDFERFYEFIKSEYGDDDNFTKFFIKALPFLKMVRDTRNCLDHQNFKGAIINNFMIHKNGTITTPTIEVKFRDTYQPQTFLSSFLPAIVESSLNVFEQLVVSLCSKNTKPNVQINVPLKNNRNKYVRYCYWMMIEGFPPLPVN